MKIINWMPQVNSFTYNFYPIKSNIVNTLLFKYMRVCMIYFFASVYAPQKSVVLKISMSVAATGATGTADMAEIV